MHQYTSNVTVYRANIEGHRYFLLVKLLKHSALDVHQSYQLTKEKIPFPQFVDLGNSFMKFRAVGGKRK